MVFPTGRPEQDDDKAYIHFQRCGRTFKYIRHRRAGSDIFTAAQPAGTIRTFDDVYQCKKCCKVAAPLKCNQIFDI